MNSKNETPVLILSLLITLGLLGGGAWLLASRSGVDLKKMVQGVDDLIPGASVSISPEAMRDRLSLGEKLLIPADATLPGQNGVKAFAGGDFSTAAREFKAALQTNPNQPETLIYLNNAEAASKNPLKIAVSVPIGANLNVSKEILRGVAQAQKEINQAGGIQGKPIQVAIANDDNKPEIVQQIAATLAQDSSILAVVGHNSSDASLAAAPIYQKAGLVMVSPTSDAKALSGVGSYIFRTIPSVRFQGDALSRYAIRTARLTTLAVCADSQAQYSLSLRDEFTSAVFGDGGKVTPTNCDFSAPDFNPDTLISRLKSEGAQGLLLIPSVNKLQQAIALARSNQGQLTLLGSSTLYTFDTLKQGQGEVNGLVLAVAWHPQAFPGIAFAQNATRLWGGPVNWRTAMAYDATEAILTGLKSNPTRSSLQQALASPQFSAPGASGSVQFLPSGDRNGAALLVEVRPGSTSGTGYDFVPLRP